MPADGLRALLAAFLALAALNPVRAQIACHRAPVDVAAEADDVDEYGPELARALVKLLVGSGAMPLPLEPPDRLYALVTDDAVGLLMIRGVFVCTGPVVPIEAYRRARAALMGEEA